LPDSVADCVFDITPDGIPRGPAYIATLEARIKHLEASSHGSLSLQGDIGDAARASSAPSAVPYGDLTIFNIVPCGFHAAQTDTGALTKLLAPQIADRCLETAYRYTQSRYCIVDWVKLREWHRQRDEVCFVSQRGRIRDMKKAYFLWIAYAIGAQITGDAEPESRAYYAQALQYLHAPLSSKDITAVQALLTMLQYSYRASVRIPIFMSIWHLLINSHSLVPPNGTSLFVDTITTSTDTSLSGAYVVLLCVSVWNLACTVSPAIPQT
jgi:hypothetical protein